MIKSEKYEQLYAQIVSLIEGEDDEVTIMANASAAIHETFDDFFWTGFYVVKNGKLQLGPFQGTVACTKIAYGRGVCGTAWAENRTIVVPDVAAFPGHIACSSLSRSEIVVPLFDHHNIIRCVLDIDSKNLNTFDDTDKLWLGKIGKVLAEKLFPN